MTLIWYGHAASMENKISCDSARTDSPVQKLTSDAVIEVVMLTSSIISESSKFFSHGLMLLVYPFSGQHWNSICISSPSSPSHRVNWLPSARTDTEGHASKIYVTGLLPSTNSFNKPFISRVILYWLWKAKMVPFHIDFFKNIKIALRFTL